LDALHTLHDDTYSAIGRFKKTMYHSCRAYLINIVRARLNYLWVLGGNQADDAVIQDGLIDQTDRTGLPYGER